MSDIDAEGGTAIPPWLYRNDLPDDQLQAFYVEQAERKWRQLHEERLALETDLRQVRAAEQKAAAFLADAREALKKYQAPGAGAIAAPRRVSRLLQMGRPGLPPPREPGGP